MKDKIEIEINPNDFEGNPNNYCSSHKGGKPYISVGFSAKSYGSGFPCDNEEEILRAIKHCKEWVIKEGDIPVVVDLRENKKVGQMTLF